jgi:nickel-dependent lactate racemase
MSEVSVPWGETEYRVSLPEHWTVGQVAKSALRPAPSDWREQLAHCLGQPAAGPPLEKLLAARRGGRVVIIVEDLTRHSPLPDILQVLLRELEHAEVGRDRVEFVFATGMHPPLTPAEAARKLGAAAEGFAWRCNCCRDARGYVTAGQCHGAAVQVDRRVAEADLRIIVSSVSAHLQAGFGGGYKMLLPGCASMATIRQMHRRGLGRNFRQLVGTDGEDNPMRVFIDDAGRMIDERHGATFALQYLLDENNLPSSVAAGEPIPTQRMLAKQCAVACGILPNQPADVLIANAHPRDFDLWQSFKCIPNTIWAARPGGVVICLARCPAGLNGMKLPRYRPGAAWVRRVLGWLGPGPLSNLVMRLAPNLGGEAAFFVRLAAHALHRNPILMVSPALHEAGIRFPGMEVLGTMEQAVAAAEAILGPGPQRVIVFPSGGTTYPAPAALGTAGSGGVA